MTRIAAALLFLLSAPAAPAADLGQPDLDALKWVSRPIIVFADTDRDPRLIQQLEAFAAEEAELDDRDVVVIVDTEPGEDSALRDKFRPRDFRVLVLGKDGQVKYRKSNPVTVREVIRLIDRMPLRREEIAARKRQATQ